MPEGEVEETKERKNLDDKIGDYFGIEVSADRILSIFQQGMYLLTLIGKEENVNLIHNELNTSVTENDAKKYKWRSYKYSSEKILYILSSLSAYIGTFNLHKTFETKTKKYPFTWAMLSRYIFLTLKEELIDKELRGEIHKEEEIDKWIYTVI